MYSFVEINNIAFNFKIAILNVCTLYTYAKLSKLSFSCIRIKYFKNIELYEN